MRPKCGEITSLTNNLDKWSTSGGIQEGIGGWNCGVRGQEFSTFFPEKISREGLPPPLQYICAFHPHIVGTCPLGYVTASPFSEVTPIPKSLFRGPRIREEDNSMWGPFPPEKVAILEEDIRWSVELLA